MNKMKSYTADKSYIALYKGIPEDVQHKITHYITCVFLSLRKFRIVKYSHAELVIDGVCYSSSVRDGGVRSKIIDLSSGKWDLIELQLSDSEKLNAKLRFIEIEGKRYDWFGAIGVILGFVKQKSDKFFCFEVVAKLLGKEKPHKFTPVEFEKEYKKKE
jgi:hypothetical protein